MTTSVPDALFVVQEAKSEFVSAVGFHITTFAGLETISITVAGKPEEKWRFTWKVTAGAEAGKVASALTERCIKPTNLAGRLIAGLLNRKLVAGENLEASIKACIGKPFMVNVAGGPKGGKPQVQSCGPPPQM